MTMNKVLRYVVLAGVFIIPFIPLIVSTFLFFPFITGKNFAFRIIVEIIFAAWLILILKDEEYRPKASWIVWAMTALMAVLTLSTIFGVNSFRSFWSNYERMEGLIGYLHLFAYLLVTIGVLNSEKLWRRFFHVSFATNIVLIIYALFQLAGKLAINQGGVRVDATLGNATYLAVYLLFHIFLALYFMLRSGPKIGLRIFYISLIILNVFLLYHTATRGAILGLIGGVILLSLILAIFDRGRARKAGVSILVVTVVFVGGFYLLRGTTFVKKSPVLSRFAHMKFSEGTTQSRIIIWGMGLRGAKERPILGWGLENFNLVFNKYYDPRLYSNEQWFDRAHNIFVDFLVSGGILGFISYLSLYIAALFVLWKRTPTLSIREKAVLTGLFAAYLFQNIFVFDNLMSSVLFMSVLGYLHTQSRVPVAETKEVKTPLPPFSFAVGAPLALVALIFSVYFLNIKPIMASSELIKAINPGEGLEANLAHFKNLFSYNTFGSVEAREQLVQYLSRIAREPSIPSEVKQKFAVLADEEMHKQITVLPGDARQFLFLGYFYKTVGDYDQAIASLKGAVSFSPNKETIIMELGATYLSRGDYENALATLKQAFDLAPDFKEARMAYAAGAIYAGKYDLAEELLVPVYGTILVPDDRIIQAFFSRKDFEKVIAIIEKRVANEPGNAQLHLSLAAAYLQVSRRADSIREIQKAIDLNPAFKEQGEHYISEIEAGRNP